MKEMWNDRYSSETFVYGKSPNEFFREQIDLLTPGKLLMPAEGEGRNAVYAATRGWLVDAFDYSEAGFHKAMKLAAEMDVELNYKVTDFENFSFKRSYYDAVGLVYFHLPEERRSQLHQKILESLVPGGMIILEAFHTSQLGNHTGGPQSLDFLFDETKLAKDFRDLHVKMLEVLTVPLKEGLYHDGDANLIRCIAVKSL